MDDNVLQTHPENPALVQIDLLADGKIHRVMCSILSRKAL